jgi:predicted nucleotidyltransferase component of viral defense system
VIPRDFLTEWRARAPWPSPEQVEQDLVISRTVVEIFTVEELRSALAWRGGTALHKLYVHPAARYSEDIDLVQLRPEPIGPCLDLLRATLDPWLGAPRRVFKEGRVNLIYRFSSEGPPSVPLRLKIEINTREHFSGGGVVAVPFQVASSWYQGSAEVATFTVEELLGTKLRALYQRKKGRDLFDLWYALDKLDVNADEIVAYFLRYLKESGLTVSRAEIERNLAEKLDDPRFGADIPPLLRTDVAFDPHVDARIVLDGIVSRVPGEPWRGTAGP